MNNKKLHIVAITAIIKHNGKCLIIKRGENEIAFPGKWTLPGGKVEDKSSAIETLKRETLEEVGLQVDKISFLSDFEFTRPDELHVVGLSFLCSVKEINVTLEDGLSDYAWIEAEDLDKYDLIDGVKKDLRLAFIK
ncbi:NUDIX hydrolase [Patescibacteria group bacterium]